MHLYLMEAWLKHSYCMQHCEKLGGRSPPVRTFEEWKTFAEEVQHIKVEPHSFPEKLWLSARDLGEMIDSKLQIQ